MIRTRKNVLSLPAGDQTLFWYGKAITAMQKKPIADPSSWRYQSAIHEYHRSEDPHASSADKLPSKSDQKKFWTQCQHGSWYFLPWHRMYLHFFEQIVLRR
jgi:tyrosinase